MYPTFRKMPTPNRNAKLHYIGYSQVLITLLLFMDQFCTVISLQSTNPSAIQSSSNYEDSKQQQNPPSSFQESNRHQYSQQSHVHVSRRPILQRQQDQQNIDRMGWPFSPSQNNQVKLAGTIDTDSYANFRTISNSTSTFNSNPVIDTFSDGSGNGPIPNLGKLSGKFDDTEDGDDDEEEEDDDYDYKDSGSGHEHPKAKNLGPALVPANNIVKNPTLNEPDFYLPFRPLLNNSGIPSTTQMPKLHALSRPPNTIPESFSTTDRTNSQELVKKITSASPEPTVLRQDTKTTTITPLIVSHSAEDRSTARVTVSISDQIFSTRTTVKPHNLLDDQLKTPNVITPTTSRKPDKFRVTDSSNSSLLRPTVPSKSEPDYEYDDENEEEDSEDTSNFEDNESIDGKILPNNNTLTSFTTDSGPSMAAYPNVQTSPKPILQTLPISSTVPREPPPISTPEQIKKPTVNHTVQANNTRPDVPKLNIPTIFENRLTTIPSIQVLSSTTDTSSVFREDDYEDEEENEDDDEEIEEELDEEEEEEEELATGFNQGQIDHRTTQSPLVPMRHDHNYGHQVPPKKGVPSIAVNKPSSPQLKQTDQVPFTEYSQNRTPKPEIPKTSVMPLTTTTSSTTTTTSTTTAATTTTTAATTTSTAATTTTTQTSRLSTYITQTPSTPPSYTSTTMQSASIRYATTPKSRVTTPVYRTHANSAFDKNSQDDTDLTREIYDKAVEVYHTTNKAISAAIEAIWPPTFEVNSSTFEPLLNQPMLFMRK